MFLLERYYQSCLQYIREPSVHCRPFSKSNFISGNEGFEKMSSSKIAESDSGAEDDIGPAYTYVIIMELI